MREHRILGLAVGCALAGVPLASAHAQQASLPVVGLLRSTPAAPFGHIVSALRKGLAEEGLTEGVGFALQQHWADNDPDRLRGLASELIRRKVSVIVGNSLAVEAARARTTSIPIVFVTSDDPVRRGLVRSLARPGGNLTGLTFFGGGQLGAKRFQLLSELAPGRVLALVADPTFPASKAERAEVEAAARASQRGIISIHAASQAELATVFETARASGAGAVMISGSPFFTSHRNALIELAARYRLPAVYDVRAFAVAGGLMSYSASFSDAYRQAGRYAGRIVKGARPDDLPVLQPTKFQLVINLKTARTLGLEVPQTLLATADEVIE